MLVTSTKVILFIEQSFKTPYDIYVPRIVKRILVISVIILILGLGAWIGLRPWWLGYEVVKRTGSLKEISFVERPMCKYWQGKLQIEEPGHPMEEIHFWLDPNQSNLIEKLDRFSKSGEKIEMQYQQARAKRFWACTPSDYKVISIDALSVVPPPQVPAK